MNAAPNVETIPADSEAPVQDMLDAPPRPPDDEGQATLLTRPLEASYEVAEEEAKASLVPGEAVEFRARGQRYVILMLADGTTVVCEFRGS
jgi:hypothetical protein